MKRAYSLLLTFILSVWMGGCSIEPNTIDLDTLPELADSDGRVSVAQMSTARAAHTATLLPDGTVLIAGGFANGEQALSSMEAYSSATDSFKLMSPLVEARQSHTATLLPNGKVLLAGGFNGDYLSSAELYDPETGLSSPAGTMNTARSGHVAVLLNDGTVLLAGGTGEGWSFLNSAELYDPTTGQFMPTDDMQTARESHTATLLHNGNVLITGGHKGRQADMIVYASAELYDAQSESFRAVGMMGIKRHKHDATILADGRVLISGGADERDAAGTYRSAEIYNPDTNGFVATASMRAARYKHAGTSLLLPDGQVLLVGGANIIEVFDSQRDQFYQLIEGAGGTRLFATATLLQDGDVLFAGGYSKNIATAGQAWILNF